MFRSVAGRCSAIVAVVFVIATSVPAAVLGSTSGAADAAGVGGASPAPDPRDEGNMAFDAARGQIVLFGGCCDDITGSSFDDTWTGDGTGWTRRTPQHRPAPRAGNMMAYDVTRARTVLFGGCCDDAGDSFGDTWTWNGSDWKLQTPAHSPPPRWGAMMAFDTERRQVVL